MKLTKKQKRASLMAGFAREDVLKMQHTGWSLNGCLIFSSQDFKNEITRRHKICPRWY
jgi:hypothetical protein